MLGTCQVHRILKASSSSWCKPRPSRTVSNSTFTSSNVGSGCMDGPGRANCMGGSLSSWFNSYWCMLPVDSQWYAIYTHRTKSTWCALHSLRLNPWRGMKRYEEVWRGMKRYEEVWRGVYIYIQVAYHSVSTFQTCPWVQWSVFVSPIYRSIKHGRGGF